MSGLGNNRSHTPEWRSQLHAFVSSTENNLQSIKKDSGSAKSYRPGSEAFAAARVSGWHVEAKCVVA